MSETERSSGERAEAAAPPAPSDGAPKAGTPQPRLRDRVNGARAGLAGAGALLLLGGGVGGYFIGHATGDDHGRDFPGVRGPDGFRGGGRGRFRHGGDGRGGFSPPNRQFNGPNGQDLPNG
jgi:hypothetical protein